jgi:hypothetical protein
MMCEATATNVWMRLWRARAELLVRATLEATTSSSGLLSTSGPLDFIGSYNLAYNPSMHENVAHILEGESFIFLLCFQVTKNASTGRSERITHECSRILSSRKA